MKYEFIQAIFLRSQYEIMRWKQYLLKSAGDTGVYEQIEGLNPGIRTEISNIDNTKGQNKKNAFLGVKAPYYIVFYSEEKTWLR